MEFKLSQLPKFRDAISKFANSSPTVADSDRLLSQLEKFESTRSLSGKLLRSNGKIKAFYVGDQFPDSHGPNSLYAIVFVKAGEIISAELYYAKGLKTKERQALYLTRRIHKYAQSRLSIDSTRNISSVARNHRYETSSDISL
ncbi:MAG: hypothetical protein GY815_05130 [Gammaproteobacteria bacterium]|nr:hypothetical protein [Gammaproteobacteria bacterium]